MALRLNVGVSRKLGLPEYSSAGASCHLELELPEGLLQTDLDEFQHRVRDAYVAAHQAVNDELARLQAQVGAGTAPGPTGRVVDRAGRDGVRDVDRPAPRPGAGRAGPSRPATPSQVKAILSTGLTHRFCIGNTDPVFSSVFREVASRGRKDREASRRYRKRTRPWMSMLRASSMV
jgi:hypothetical protein